jgi:cation-transporting ATPase E
VIALEIETGVPIQEYMGQIETEAVQIAQTALTTLMIFCGLLLVVFVEPPTQFFVGGDAYSGDWRPTILVVLLLIGFGIVILFQPLRDFFEIQLLSIPDYALIAVVSFVWAVALRHFWRARWFDRFLNLPMKRSILNNENIES